MECSVCYEPYVLDSASGSCVFDATKCTNANYPQTANLLYNYCESCPYKASSCEFNKSISRVQATACESGFKLTEGVCVNASTPLGSYFGYDLTWQNFSEGVYPCPTGYADCYFNYNTWMIVGVACKSDFTLTEKKTCVLSNGASFDVVCKAGEY